MREATFESKGAIRFSDAEIAVVKRAAALAEELVSEHYKMSESQWLRGRYDIRTAQDLDVAELVDGPFAQVIRYEGRRRKEALNSEAFDFYQICLQDHAILSLVRHQKPMDLLAFVLYVITHELIHIVRFSMFLQSYEASETERLDEEARVHRITRTILEPVRLEGLSAVFEHYRLWEEPFEKLERH